MPRNRPTSACAARVRGPRLSNLLGASLITIRIFAERLAAAEGRDVADIIVETCEYVDA